MPISLDAATRRALRARAHHLDPVVAIGLHGLTPAVVHEIDVALLAHELIKVRVFSDDRAARAALLDEVVRALDAAPVQQVGKLFVLWRPNPDKQAAKRRSTGTARNRKRPAGTDDPRKKSSAKAGARGKGAKANARKRGSGAAGAAAQARERRRRAEADATAPPAAPRGRARPEPPAPTDERPPPRSAPAPRGRPAPPGGVPRAAQPRRRRAR
jgi:putative YhbY family RNA-binding protein